MAAVLGLWVVAAVYADGWAHLNRPDLESFFTPWHGALYAGFTLLAGWVGWLDWRRRHETRSWQRALPAGYGFAALGVLIFIVGGVADMLWHVVFGVEAGLDALVSPTHLMLLVGGMLLLASPVRAVLLSGSARMWPAVVALASTAALAGFFLSYVSVFVEPLATEPLTTIPEGTPGHRQAESPAIVGLAGYLVTTAVLVIPLLVMARRRRLPAGTVTVVVAVVAVTGAALAEFRYGLAALAAVVGAAVVDLVRARMQRLDLRGLAVLVPAFVWPAQLAGLAITEGVRWPVELWFGVVGLTALAASVLGGLARQSPTITG
ncbi:MAG: hypothetical protein GEV07_14370 [Streptosporangiales bacterium]|nr:hypothetical protein [Streptosporangiales bacterium]